MDMIELAESVPDGSLWRHHSGRIYRVIGVANNVPDPKPDYPPTVVYQSVVNGKLWAGRLEDWHRRMTLLDDARALSTKDETR